MSRLSNERTIVERVHRQVHLYQRLGQPFTSRRIWLCLGSRPAQSAVSTILSRMANLGKVEAIGRYQNRCLLYQ